MGCSSWNEEQKISLPSNQFLGLNEIKMLLLTGANALILSPDPTHPFPAADISEIESYRSYSPQDDRRAHHSDLSSHSSTERLREKPRWVFCCTLIYSVQLFFI